ncbi:MAG: UDP-glucose 4-epimerase GalE [Candidatus Korobacteraceae bacterium]|jgi:UDP-glucose 4-epimerase
MVLVIGGAGYIGSFTCHALAQRGHKVVVLDDLSSGHVEAIDARWLVRGDFGDRSLLRAVIRDHGVDAVVHFAAATGELQSTMDPTGYYRTNVIKTLELLATLQECGVQHFVFSSSGAVYGDARFPIAENGALRPRSCYGRTKLAVESALEDYRVAHEMGYAVLRYFNAAGASPDGQRGEDHRPETHLIPALLDVAMGRREAFVIMGDDFETADGTAVRDYVHVEDIAQAHVLALEGLQPGQSICCNVGTGRGTSVRETISAVEQVTGLRLATRTGKRRSGDCALRVADSNKIRSLLGWSPRYTDVVAIVQTAWAWHRSHPHGY